MLEGLGFVSAIVLFIIGLAYGKWQDIYFRVKMKRKFPFLKSQNAICLNVVMPGGSIKSFAVNPEGEMISIMGRIWFFNQNKLCRMEKVKKNNKVELVEEKEKGFKVSESHIKWEEGTPCLYVDVETMKPIALNGNEEAALRPEEASAFFYNYLENEKSKANKNRADHDKLIKICVILVAGCLLVAGFAAWQTMQLNDKMDVVEARTRSINEPAPVPAVGEGLPLPPDLRD